MKLSYRNATAALPDLCREVLRYGLDVPSRNGNTRELTMLQVELNQPWPLEITSVDRNVSIAAQIAETMWVLSGRNDVEWLAHYLPQAPKFSDDGETWRGGYGPRLRSFRGQMDSNSCVPRVDQLQHVLKLLKEDPTTRRAVMSIYDPGIDTEPGKDIPCNNWLHFLGRDGKLNLHVAIRSNDLMWGWSGINSFEWSALLVIVAGLVGQEVGSVTFSISSLHLYERHFEKASRIAAGRGSAPVFSKGNPTFHMPANLGFEEVMSRWFGIEAHIRERTMSASDLNLRINSFPEPMLRSWLQVLAGWWHGYVPDPIAGTSLAYALAQAPKPKLPTPAAPGVDTAALADFLQEADALHRGKDKAYGPSWCKRGELMSIMANIARKVDRLGVDGGGDTSLDTAQDLMIYLAKYRVWLRDELHATGPVAVPVSLSDRHGEAHCDQVKARLNTAASGPSFASELKLSTAELETAIKNHFLGLEDFVIRQQPRETQVRILQTMAAALAYKLWLAALETLPVPGAETEAEFLGNDTKADQWRAENATRFFNGYNDTEGQ